MSGYNHTTATEYSDGYSVGYDEGRVLLANSSSAAVPARILEAEEDMALAPRPFTLAYCLGYLRGLRHSTWKVR